MCYVNFFKFQFIAILNPAISIQIQELNWNLNSIHSSILNGANHNPTQAQDILLSYLR